MDISTILDVDSLTHEIKEGIDYWKDYKGETIRIEDVNVTLGDGTASSAVHTTNAIRGEVEKVMTLPPGFVLRDVTVYTNSTEISGDGVPDQAVMDDEHERMFVSFDIMNRVVFDPD